jgi:hypothetical protein
MGDFQGHPFRGNQYSVGTSVKHSEAGMRHERERAANYQRKYGTRPEHRAYDEKQAMRGKITALLTAEKDSFGRKKGDFVAYEVQWEPSSRYPEGHKSQTLDIVPAQDDNAAAAAKASGYEPAKPASDASAKAVAAAIEKESAIKPGHTWDTSLNRGFGGFRKLTVEKPKRQRKLSGRY